MTIAFSYVLLIAWNSLWPSGEIPALKAVISRFFFSTLSLNRTSNFWVLRPGISPGAVCASSSTVMSTQCVRLMSSTLFKPDRVPGLSANWKWASISQRKSVPKKINVLIMTILWLGSYAMISPLIDRPLSIFTITRDPTTYFRLSKAKLAIASTSGSLLVAGEFATEGIFPLILFLGGVRFLLKNNSWIYNNL